MKTFFKGAFFTAAAVLMFSSCNKDQTAVNRMEGDWKIKSQKTYLNNVEVVDTTTGGSDEEVTLSFESCKLKDDEFCGATMTITVSGQTISNAFKYNVSEDAEKMTWDMDNNLTTTEDRINATVNNISKKEVDFYYTETDGSDTWKYEIVLEPK